MLVATSEPRPPSGVVLMTRSHEARWSSSRDTTRIETSVLVGLEDDDKHARAVTVVARTKIAIESSEAP